MPRRMLKRKGSSNILIDVFIEHQIYDKLQSFRIENGFDEATALTLVLERGMADFWLQEFKHLKESYLPLEELHKKFKKDNEVFKSLHRQNEQLRDSLKQKSLSKTMGVAE
jgi:hypothetical protein